MKPIFIRTSEEAHAALTAAARAAGLSLNRYTERVLCEAVGVTPKLRKHGGARSRLTWPDEFGAMLDACEWSERLGLQLNSIYVRVRVYGHPLGRYRKAGAA